MLLCNQAHPAICRHPYKSTTGRNIFRTSGLFFINENGGVRVADDERVEVE
jgi:hypothetical protein